MKARLDHRIICRIIEHEAKVLDLGCGEGDLLKLLVDTRKARVQGIELSDQAIFKCVEKGLSVTHGDMESGIQGYPDKAFDYVILNQSMQEARNASAILHEAMRIGHKAIVGFPNFAYIQSRLRMLFKGKVPITRSLPYRWYNTPNLHFLSTTDFNDFCRAEGITVHATYYCNERREVTVLPNMFALSALFVISK